MASRQTVIHRTDRETVAPTAAPVSLDTVKAFLRVLTTDEDDLIATLLATATGVIQTNTGRQLMPATRAFMLDDWPADKITVPRPPLTAVSSIGYLDADGAAQTWDSDNYQVDTASEPGRITVEPDQAFPDLEAGRLLPVTVTYTCGYTDQEAIPAELRHAVMVMTEHLFTNRELIKTGTIVTKVPLTAAAVIDAWKIDWL